MSTALWNYKQQSLPTATWLRSWRQELFTDYNSDFTIRCHMEEITCDGDQNRLGSSDQGIVERRLSQVMADPDVQLLNEVLTLLVQKWFIEDHATPAPEPVVPDPTPTPDPQP